MGFLDDLKRQADAARARESTDSAALERNAALAEGACATMTPYLLSLAQQLNVLRPVSRLRYELDVRNVFEGLQRCDFRVDARRTRLRGNEVCDHLVLHWHLRSGRRVSVRKELPQEIDKFEARLRQAGAETVGDPTRHPDTGRPIEMRYDFTADFRASVRVTPDHDNARLRFQLRNIERFDTVHAEFAAIEVGNARLDDLARWIVGEPHRFLDGALAVRRIEG